MNKINYAEIREMYKNLDMSYYDPYPIDWIRLFTHIEYAVWCDIRDYPINMWPQYPIGKYFADFANIEKKIVIECDGKQWHDPEKDAIRDAEMMKDGWRVYRIPGKECIRVVHEEKYETYNLEEKEEANRKYFKDLYESSTGIIKAIYHFHFKPIIKDENEFRFASRALASHSNNLFYQWMDEDYEDEEVIA